MLRALLLGSAATLAFATVANAADFYSPMTPEPIYEAGGFDWSGAYFGVLGGGVFEPGFSDGAVGAFLGYNFVPVDPILLGVDFTYTYDWRESYHSTKMLISGRVGAIVADSVLVYALAGAGLWATSYPDQDNAYQLGGGIELAVTDSVSVRGEVVGIGSFEDTDTDFFDWTRASVGVAYHF
jgi:outer membrane immunogenic protein